MTTHYLPESKVIRKGTNSMNKEHNRKMPTEEELRGMFKVLGEEVPGLLGKLTKILYGVKESEDFGKAVGNFYKALIEAGMSNEQAFQLTQEYMGNMNIGKTFEGFGGHISEHGRTRKIGPEEARSRDNGPDQERSK